MTVSKSLKPIAIALVGLISLAGCSSSAPTTSASSSSAAASSTAQVQVVASTNVWGEIAGQIGGDRVAVTSIISDPNQDPHEFQASTRNQLALSQAQLVIENGGGYDDFVDTMLKSANNTTAPVLNAVSISGFTASGGEELNEHVWYSYPTVQKVAEAIRDALTKIDPTGASTYSANTTTFVSGLDKLSKSAADVKATYAGKGAAITEPVPLYLLDAMGLVNKTPEAFSEAIENDTDVSAKVLNQTLALFTNHEVAVFAYNEQTTGAQTEKVLAAAKAAGVPVVPVQETLPSGKTYLEWQAGIITAIGEALAQ